MKINIKKIILSITALPVLLWPQAAFAHCPLCTIGAGGAAVLATWLGVGTFSIGVFIGAFAVATGLWFARLIKKRLKKPVKFLTPAIAIASFLLTIIPIMPMMPGYGTFSLFWGGEYGSIFNRTYLIHLFLFGSLVGGGVMLISPKLSKALAKIQKKQLPFQGIIMTFLLLILISIISELLS